MSTENHRVTLKVIILKIIYLKVIYFKENCLSERMVRTQKHLKKFGFYENKWNIDQKLMSHYWVRR